MYEYAARAIAGNKCGASLVVKNKAVGPSAPPIIPTEAASCGVIPHITERKNATKIPN